MPYKLLFPTQTSKVDVKDIHQILWKCRDFELTSLWQRSIFLTTLLVLCYTGYGFLFSAIVNKQKTPTVLINAIKCTPNNQDSKSLLMLHAAAFFISIVGILFSCLWIAMAKGSKAWYERYEKTIVAFEKDARNIEDRARPYAAFQGYEYSVLEKADVNSSLFSMDGGAYSPSKINIAIGQISAFIYLIICIVHTGILLQMFNIFNVKCILNSTVILMSSILILTPILTIALLLIWNYGWIKSSIIKEYPADESYNNTHNHQDKNHPNIRKSTSICEWIKSKISILLLIWVIALHFIYLLGREGGFSNAAKAELETLPIYPALLAIVWFSYARQNKKNG